MWNRGYFHKPTVLARWKWKLSILAVVVAGGWLLLGQVALTEQSRLYRYSHGPVAGVHAAWDQNCEACHQQFSVGAAGLTGLADVHERWRQFRCESCHSGPAGDPKNYAQHHASAQWPAGMANDCSVCHHDHQGRDFSLVKLPNSDCTQCHRDLPAHLKTRSSAFASTVGRFEGGHDDSHPAFRTAGPGVEHPRSLHFNHAMHLLPGMMKEEAVTNRGKSVWKIGELDKGVRQRYCLPGQTDNDAVVLTCSSCHQLDAGRVAGGQSLETGPERALPVDAIMPPRAAGAYMLPVIYEKHCAACHAIETGPFALDQAKLSLESVRVPHRIAPADLDHLLRREILSRIVQSPPPQPPSADLESRNRLDPRVDEELGKLRTYDDVVSKLADKAKDQLFIPIRSPAGGFGGSNCLKCHEGVPAADGKNVQQIVRPNTPVIWFEHARFNHASHRAMDCASCHPVAGRPYTAGEVEPVSVPGIENCRQCHAPRGRIEINGVMQMGGGVRHDCVDCHRYHGGDFPLEGIGSAHRGPPEGIGLGTGDFLRGTRPTANRETP